MRHSQKTAQLNYQKVFTTEQKEDNCRETKESLVELEQELTTFRERVNNNSQTLQEQRESKTNNLLQLVRNKWSK
jgi:hypothetical protein